MKLVNSSTLDTSSIKSRPHPAIVLPLEMLLRASLWIPTSSVTLMLHLTAATPKLAQWMEQRCNCCCSYTQSTTTISPSSGLWSRCKNLWKSQTKCIRETHFLLQRVALCFKILLKSSQSQETCWFFPFSLWCRFTHTFEIWISFL